jgi:hypothetical protein
MSGGLPEDVRRMSGGCPGDVRGIPGGCPEDVRGMSGGLPEDVRGCPGTFDQTFFSKVWRITIGDYVIAEAQGVTMGDVIIIIIIRLRNHQGSRESLTALPWRYRAPMGATASP